VQTALLKLAEMERTKKKFVAHDRSSILCGLYRVMRGTQRNHHSARSPMGVDFSSCEVNLTQFSEISRTRHIKVDIKTTAD
jgi:hypothetical protein